MTLGELKIACYKLINPTDVVLYPDRIIDTYESDPNYSYYFLNMTNSIDSAITRMTQELVLPLQRYDIDESTLSSINIDDSEPILTISLDTLFEEEIFKLYKLKKIEFFDGKVYRKINYRLIGKYLEVPNMLKDSKQDDKYVIYFYPRIDSLSSYVEVLEVKDKNENNIDLSKLGINDTLASIISLYVKADLLEHDKPSEAVLARNTFDQYLQSFEQDEVDVNEAKLPKSWWSGML